ncbi:MAG: alkaline phosphatase family protein [Candidatus Manganitrophus sp.]|nr:MAG: alkaline phosphatase family protein [Candidatus Manganitrophus sp.]
MKRDLVESIAEEYRWVLEQMNLVNLMNGPLMLKKTVVINVVGLTQRLLGPATPSLSEWAKQGKVVPIEAVTPAVTCTAQATYLTGSWPEQHGIVGNGWYFRDECEIKFWRQSNRLVQAPKLWEIARAADPGFTCANLFWWFNMHSTADYSITPRPMYPADGRKIPDIYTRPGAIRKRSRPISARSPSSTSGGRPPRSNQADGSRKQPGGSTGTTTRPSP